MKNQKLAFKNENQTLTSLTFKIKIIKVYGITEESDDADVEFNMTFSYEAKAKFDSLIFDKIKSNKSVEEYVLDKGIARINDVYPLNSTDYITYADLEVEIFEENKFVGKYICFASFRNENSKLCAYKKYSE
ncbi:hypothetical protein [Photorhabdus luminescens]|uniref:Uncharacterized protein n=1 Tax=Photorhabdus luminescens subsp. sonorensis TaxID=1173677 RepID=A0A5C4RI80_PHOLU|nr:hypothetical protein [Photorhabdus luminescens]TNH43786.1 hypothetical protein EP164_09580 [Photorhabdus luminescens subsp. sonorensis]